MNKQQEAPTSQQWEVELKREQHKSEYHKMLRSTVYILLIVAAVAVLVATIWLPVLRVTGTSMEPTFEPGQIVVALKDSPLKKGDLIAFYYNNEVLLKRVIGLPGDMILIQKDGTVFVNHQKLQEPYITSKSFGQCNIQFPYQVPENKYFVLGDHRATALDSRSSSIGCIPKNLVIGKVSMRVWPFHQFGIVR